jgi:hypothetical protein
MLAGLPGPAAELGLAERMSTALSKSHLRAPRTLIWQPTGPDPHANTNLAAIAPTRRQGSRRAGVPLSICWDHMSKPPWRRAPASPTGKAGFVARSQWNPAISGFRELLRLGEDLEVVAPAPLRNQVKQALRGMLRNYQAERSR